VDYSLEDISKAVKAAREAKGLSQRALSSLVGIPQSHLSKIESGNVDIRLSSLIQLARNLDLDLKLVPKKALPAVESIIRSIRSPGDRTSAPRPAYTLDDEDE
jgi:HTH-type transcriptional regulator / antitoxin HipB